MEPNQGILTGRAGGRCVSAVGRDRPEDFAGLAPKEVRGSKAGLIHGFESSLPPPTQPEH